MGRHVPQTWLLWLRHSLPLFVFTSLTACSLVSILLVLMAGTFISNSRQITDLSPDDPADRQLGLMSLSIVNVSHLCRQTTGSYV